MKKAQVTLLVIIALILVIMIIMIIQFSKDNSSNNIKNSDFENVRIYTHDCLTKISTEVVYRIGSKGGHYFPINDSTSSGITYYDSLPTKNEIEKEISFYTEKLLFTCLKNYKNFPDYTIYSGVIDIDTKIKDKEIALIAKYPIKISKGEKTTIYEDFEVILPIRLGILIDSSNRIMKDSVQGICLSCMLNESLTYDYFVDFYYYNENSIIFIFKDGPYRKNDEAFKFIFAKKNIRLEDFKKNE